MRNQRNPPQPLLRGFWSLIVTQFEGAFNDNALKMVVTFVGLNMALSQGLHDALVPLTAALFSLPFLLFSMAGGFLADRFSKRTVTIGVKLLEILIMTFATLGLLLRSLPMGLAAIFLMGLHSAIFGPSKYGLLPELLPERRLSWGNGILELGTFLAIITGMAAGAVLYKSFEGRQAWSGVVLIGLAVVGPGVQPWHLARAGGQSAQEVPRQLPGRSVAADQGDAPGPRAVAGLSGQHLLLVHRAVAAAGRD